MKTKLLFSIVIIVGVLAIAPKSMAYGGGIGFPPGYFDNPHPNPGLICELVTEELPNGNTVTVPRCHVERNENQTKNYLERIADFFERVKHGGR